MKAKTGDLADKNEHVLCQPQTHIHDHDKCDINHKKKSNKGTETGGLINQFEKVFGSSQKTNVTRHMITYGGLHEITPLPEWRCEHRTTPGECPGT